MHNSSLARIKNGPCTLKLVKDSTPHKFFLCSQEQCYLLRLLVLHKTLFADFWPPYLKSRLSTTRTFIAEDADRVGEVVAKKEDISSRLFGSKKRKSSWKISRYEQLIFRAGLRSLCHLSFTFLHCFRSFGNFLAQQKILPLSLVNFESDVALLFLS